MLIIKIHNFFLIVFTCCPFSARDSISRHKEDRGTILPKVCTNVHILKHTYNATQLSLVRTLTESNKLETVLFTPNTFLLISRCREDILQVVSWWY